MRAYVPANVGVVGHARKALRGIRHQHSARCNASARVRVERPVRPHRRTDR
jgi:hypothetical protein